MIRQLYLTPRFFLAFGGVSFVFVLGFFIDILFPIAQVLFAVALTALLADGLLLFGKRQPISAKRILSNFFSIGEQNPVTIQIRNLSSLLLGVRVIDEAPVQLQARNQSEHLRVAPRDARQLTYYVRPLTRGLYAFGKLNIYVSTALGLIERRIRFVNEAEVKVYPSVMQMKRFELRTLHKLARYEGVKKVRKIGHSYEFEQIKEYVPGDDYRAVNWKATGRQGGKLMVNQYEDERAQQIYTLIDKSRSMRLPFHGLSLMDHAINTALVLTNVALQKTDRPGLITFADKIDSIIKANSSPLQLEMILQSLYNQTESDLEGNFELLYRAVRKYVKGRSLLVLMSNFETLHSMERALPLLRRLSRLHLMVVIFFENTEIADYSNTTAENLEDIYDQTIARKFLAEKKRMVTELENYGIKAVLTRPEDLTVHVINAYLELKARGMI